jgi:hypothetical protein
MSVTKVGYVQVPVSGGAKLSDGSATNAFGSSSELQFTFTVPKGSELNLGRSYLRFNTQLQTVPPTGTARAPVLADGITFAPNPIACMLRECRFLANGTPISQTQQVGLIDTMTKRGMYSDAWRNTAGASQFLFPDFESRNQLTATDGGAGASVTLGLDDLGFSPVAAGGTGTQLAVTANTTVSGTVAITGTAGLLIDLRNFFKVGDFVNIGATQNNNFGYITAVTINGFTWSGGAATAAVAADVWVTGANPAIPITVRRGAGSNQSANVDLTWTPDCIGLAHDKGEDGWLPAGQYTLGITPWQGTQWMTNCVQTLDASVVPTSTGLTAGNGFKVLLTQQFMYACIRQNTASGHGKAFQKDCIRSMVRFNDFSGPSTQQASMLFTVDQGSRGFAVATVSNQINNSPLYPPSILSLANSASALSTAPIDKSLVRLDIEFAGEHSDPYQLESTYTPSATDFRYSTWLRSQQERELYFNDAGCESFASWGGKSTNDGGWGEYYYHLYHLPEGNQANAANITFQYAVAPTNCRMALVTEILQTVTLHLNDGVVVGAEARDVI